MPSDLDIITQLEQRIGKKLKKLTKIYWNSVGYLANDQQQVIGLGLSECKLAELPPEIAQLQNLQRLDLESNQLSALPPEFAQLQNLQILGLGSNQLSALPPEIAQLQNLQTLNLGSNQLSALPPEFAQLQNLKELYLHSNQLSALPPEIAQLQKLQTLELNSNQLSALPPKIAQLQNLQRLNLRSNQLSALPPEIAQLQNLQELRLNSNQLSALPPEIAQLQNLQVLWLNSNQLSALPPEFAQLQNLQELRLDSNQLSALPPEIAQLQNLQTLYLASNQLSALPPEIAQLQNLQVLWLNSNQLSALPPEIAQLQNLQKLYLASNQLSALPPEIAQLQNLQVLRLDSNQLSALPPEIAQLQNLQELYLDSNQLSVLPPEIAQLQNLQELYLDSNQLSALPPEIAQLQKLQRLDLESNQLSALPPEIAQLQNLQRLSLDSNQLSALPPEIAQLQNLQFLDLRNNPLTTPPYEIAMEGMDAIRDYFDALGKHPCTLNELKVILVGDGAAGKTSLVKQLFGETFDKHESQTHGIRIRDWTFSTAQTQDIKAHLWDFGGQEIMHATHQFFLSKRSLYLLILDGRKDEKTEYWLQHIESFGDKSPTLIVLNKMDENPSFDVNRKFLKEKYPFIVDFYKVSCKTKEGIAELQPAMQRAVLNIEILQTLWPINWLAVKRALEQQNKDKVDYIPYDSYIGLCKQNGVEREDFQRTLIKFLHDLGVVIHFPEALLAETNVINPEWVTQGVYDIITSKLLANKSGMIAKSEISQLLNCQTHPTHKHGYIIELMKKFELCYELDDKQTILVPDLLPVGEPNFTIDVQNAVNFILEYKFLPKSVIAKFIVKMHGDIKQQLRWRTGVVIEDTQFAATAVIKVDEEAKRIFINVNGQQKREYLAIILYTFHKIHDLFAKIDVTELVCLPDNPEKTVDYKELIGLEQRGKKEYSTAERDYPLSELLGSVRTEDSMQEMLSILRKLSEQVLTKEEFFRKSEDMLKQIAEQSKSEEDLKEKLNKIIMMEPNIMGFGINFNELLGRTLRWFRGKRR